MSLRAWLNANPSACDNTHLLLVEAATDEVILHVRDDATERHWQMATRDHVDTGLLRLLTTTAIGSISPGVPAGMEVQLKHVHVQIANTRCVVVITLATPNQQTVKSRLIGPLSLDTADRATSLWRSSTVEATIAKRFLMWDPSPTTTTTSTSSGVELSVRDAVRFFRDRIVFADTGDYSLVLSLRDAGKSDEIECLDGDTTVAPIAQKKRTGLRVWKYVVRVVTGDATLQFRLVHGLLLDGCRLTVRKL